MREILPASDTNVNKKKAICLDVATTHSVLPQQYLHTRHTLPVIFSVISIIVMYITYILLIKHFI